METDYIDVSEVTKLNNLQIYQQDKALIDMQIATAKAYPRDIVKATNRCIALVSFDKELAASCTYSLPKGGKPITGPSVHLARLLAKQMGNLRADVRVLSADGSHVTCEAVCFDLETNYAYRTQIKKSIVGSKGRYSEDMITITMNACSAIAFRNAVFSVVDDEIVKKVQDAAKKVVLGDVSTEQALIARRTKVVEGYQKAYASFAITDDEIAKSVGRITIEQITAEDLIVLIGFEKALATGEATIESIFRPQAQRYTPPPPKSEEKEDERLLLLIKAAKTKPALEKLAKDLSTSEQRMAYDEKFKTFN